MAFYDIFNMFMHMLSNTLIDNSFPVQRHEAAIIASNKGDLMWDTAVGDIIYG